MNYRNFQVEDLLTNESFLNYCNQQNDKDIEFWNNWLKENPDKAEVAGQAKALFEQLRADLKVREEYKEEILQFKTQFAFRNQIPTNIKRPLRLRKILQYTAAACILLVIAFWPVHEYYSNQNTAFTSSKQRGNYHKEKLVLPDGTVVTLNANSSLVLDKDYNQSKRKVYLKGEAFFEVTKNKHKPFIVQSSNVSTTALGTSFLVRYYPNEAQVKVLLVTGKVKVETSRGRGKSKRSVILMPSQQIVINRKEADQPLKKSVFSSEVIEQWKDNILIFKDTPFEEVLQKLEECYGVKIEVVNQPWFTRHITGEFRNKSLKSVLDALSFANKFKYTQTEQYVKIVF